MNDIKNCGPAITYEKKHRARGTQLYLKTGTPGEGMLEQMPPPTKPRRISRYYLVQGLGYSYYLLNVHKIK